jgi:hypothetical protein
MFEQLAKMGAKLGVAMLVVVMLYAGCSQLLASKDGSPVILGFFLSIPIWLVGRISWARRARRPSSERPKPRRRALPPPPIDGTDGWVDN